MLRNFLPAVTTLQCRDSRGRQNGKGWRSLKGRRYKQEREKDGRRETAHEQKRSFIWVADFAMQLHSCRWMTPQKNRVIYFNDLRRAMHHRIFINHTFLGFQREPQKVEIVGGLVRIGYAITIVITSTTQSLELPHFPLIWSSLPYHAKKGKIFTLIAFFL